MNISSATEQEFEDVYLDITKSEKRFVQVSGKTYDGTGSYNTIKLLKNIDGKQRANKAEANLETKNKDSL